MRSETRKVQQVGHSTLMVSLPKEWVIATGLSPGEALTIQRDDNQVLHILPVGSQEKKEILKCILDADKCDNKGLLTRLITGIYIIGYETLDITSAKGFDDEKMTEIRNVIQRLTGMNIVEENTNQLVIKNFLDPTRFPTNGLLRRLYIITSWMQDASIKGLKERKRSILTEAINMENEVDRLYRLVVRQLLLAVRDRSIEKKLGVESSMNIVGDRTVAKVIEKIGDLSEEIAKEVLLIIEKEQKIDNKVVDDLEQMFKQTHNVYEITMKGFFSTDIIESNEAIERMKNIRLTRKKVRESILSKFRKGLIDNGESDLSTISAYLSLNTIIINLEQISTFTSTIAEITINRAVEKENDILKIQKIAASDDSI